MGIVKLKELAFARSGDKGEDVDLTLFAKTPEAYALLETYVTEKQMSKWFNCKVVRYALPKQKLFHFILQGYLQGGASLTERWDSQGKSLGAACLEFSLEV